MKKFFAGIAIFLLIIGAAAYALNSDQPSQSDNEYLRIHVRANSNEQIDQDIKYVVKDEVVKFITPYVAQCVDKQTAIEVIGSITSEIEEVCNETLRAHGFDYTSRASIRAEEFPTRVYGELTLEQGVYDALIVELGTGTGDNWWCVIYPPLCFTSATTNVEYRSAIYEIIEKFKTK